MVIMSSTEGSKIYASIQTLAIYPVWNFVVMFFKASWCFEKHDDCQTS